MATRRIKEITNTATTFASDDFIALDGTSQGTRKMDKDDLISQVSAGVSGDYLEEANNLSDVASLDTSKLNMEIPDVGTAPNEVPLNGQLGTMAFQDSAGVSVGQLEVTDKLGVGVTPSGNPLEVAGTNGNFSIAADGNTANFSRNAANYIAATADTSSALAVLAKHSFQVHTGASTTERLRVDSGGNLILTKGGGAYLQLKDASAVRGAINVGTSDGLIFTTGASFTERWSINSSGNLVGSGGGQILYNDGDVLFPGATANLNWDKSASNLILGTGAGIDFGSGASTTLDSYEEGTFTPTAGGTWTSAPTSLSGSYVKVGDLVYAVITFGASSSKSSSTSGYLDGLPFNVNGSSVGSVSDVGVRDLGNCLAANVTRVWLTETSFPATATASVVYRTS